MSLRIAITGAAGMGATGIRPLLREAGHELVLIDVAEVEGVVPGSETSHRMSVTDRDGLSSAFAGTDVVVHLGGFSKEHTWENVLSVNIDGTNSVLVAAHEAGVDRVLLASSTHAIGFWPVGTDPDRLTPRPDTYYGVGKVALEALGSVFADRFGMTVVAARIGTFAERPAGRRYLSTWLSYADLVRLVEATATTDAGGYHLVWATSANTRRWFPLEPGYAIGYRPQDDAERVVDPATVTDEEDVNDLIGSAFAHPDHPLGVPWSR